LKLQMPSESMPRIFARIGVDDCSCRRHASRRLGQGAHRGDRSRAAEQAAAIQRRRHGGFLRSSWATIVSRWCGGRRRIGVTSRPSNPSPTMLQRGNQSAHDPGSGAGTPDGRADAPLLATDPGVAELDAQPSSRCGCSRGSGAVPRSQAAAYGLSIPLPAFAAPSVLRHGRGMRPALRLSRLALRCRRALRRAALRDRPRIPDSRFTRRVRIPPIRSEASGAAVGLSRPAPAPRCRPGSRSPGPTASSRSC